MLLMAAIQMVSEPGIAANLAMAADLLAEAAGRGAQLAVLPENFALMGRRETDKLAVQEAPGVGPIQDFLAEQAARHRLWLVGGTLPLRTADDGARVRAACLLFNDRGQQVARYDKAHLFDVQTPGSQERYAESATIEPGNRYIVADTPWGRLGLAVCYDLRFPDLFQALAARGAEMIALPASFTMQTGKDHWEVLCRARAIETETYFLACGQTGSFQQGNETRWTYGHSLVVDPWGHVVAKASDGVGVVSTRIDPARVKKVRAMIPVAQHKESFA